MLKPDFFIVGAPKSGTTALYSYLKQHPDVFLPKKELYYFCYDLLFRTPPISEDIYLSYYEDATSQKAVGDTSVYYLISEHAAKKIKEFNPEAKVIIMLREPVSMIYSLHSQLLSDGNENIEAFEDALAAEEPRAEGLMVPPNHPGPRDALFYIKIGKYYEQVKRYMDVFDKEHLHIILFDDFVKDPKEEYKKVLKFLQLECVMPKDFETVNPNKVPRSKALLRFVISGPLFIKKIASFLFPHHSKRREWLLDTFWKVNTKYVARKPINSATQNKLKEIFKKDIQNLQILLGRDLSAWLK